MICFKGFDKITCYVKKVSYIPPLFFFFLNFTVANILTVQRLLHICIYFESVGSLIISMGRMLSNVFKFAVVGALIVFSFALGFAQLMAPYSDLGSCEDDDFHVDHCGNAEMFERFNSLLI